MSAKETEPVRAIGKACRLLDLMKEARRPMSLGELAEATGWAKSTVHGLLQSMRGAGLVEQSAQSGRYELGIRLFEYGNAVQSTKSILTLCTEPMRRLVERTGESATLSMLDRGEAMVLAHAEADSSFHIASETGAHLPAFATAQGKALLSSLSDASVKRIFEERYQPLTPHTISDANLLLAELKSVRANGYAVENGEFKVGIRGVAAPIYDHLGTVRYAIGLIGLFRRVDSDEFREATARVLETAKELSAALGYRA